MEKSARVKWTNYNCRIGAYLSKGGISASANVQACDTIELGAMAGSDYQNYTVEYAEFQEGPDGKIDTKLTETGQFTAEGLSKMPASVILDDVGDKRTWSNALQILKHDTEQTQKKIKSVKIDIKPATKAYHSKSLFPPQDISSDDAYAAAIEINKFVEEARRIRPDINFTVECTVLETSKLQRVPALHEMPGVSFQACHLADEEKPGAAAIPLQLDK